MIRNERCTVSVRKLLKLGETRQALNPFAKIGELLHTLSALLALVNHSDFTFFPLLSRDSGSYLTAYQKQDTYTD